MQILFISENHTLLYASSSQTEIRIDENNGYR